MDSAVFYVKQYCSTNQFSVKNHHFIRNALFDNFLASGRYPLDPLALSSFFSRFYATTQKSVR